MKAKDDDCDVKSFICRLFGVIFVPLLTSTDSMKCSQYVCRLCCVFQPGCEYTVQLKSGDVNAHIERSMPRTRHIRV